MAYRVAHRNCKDTILDRCCCEDSARDQILFDTRQKLIVGRVASTACACLFKCGSQRNLAAGLRTLDDERVDIQPRRLGGGCGDWRRRGAVRKEQRFNICIVGADVF